MRPWRSAMEARRWLSGVCVLLPFFLGGCIAIPLPARLGGGSAVLLERKIVAELREPNLLVASDRTVCEVSMERYERTRRGDRVMCDWRRDVRF